MISGVKPHQGKHSYSNRSRKTIEIETEMAELEAIQTVATQVAIQAAMAAVMVMMEVDAGPTSGTNAVSSGEACRHRHGVPALRQPSFNWNTPDDYVELLSFEMEVTNILQARTYKLTEDETVPIIRNWLGREGLQLIQTLINSKKVAYKRVEGMFSSQSENFKPHHSETILSLQ